MGPRDETDRFTYWPVRIDRGGEVLAPGDPTDPVQIIDARDLAEWTIRMAEKGGPGTYNATGPDKPLTIGGMLDGIKDALKTNAQFTWVNADFLKAQKVEAWSDMPVWTGDESGMARTNNSRAIAQGLTFRPLAETARDTSCLVQITNAGAPGQAKGRAHVRTGSRSAHRLSQGDEMTKSE